MSMLSPEAYIDLECKGKTYGELLNIRRELFSEIYDFENGKISQDAWKISPSPDVIYKMNLQYLAELCKLIADTYGSETAKVELNLEISSQIVAGERSMPASETVAEETEPQRRDLLMSVRTRPVQSPWDELKVDVYNSEKDNVDVHREQTIDPTNADITFTLPEMIFTRIRNYMENPVLRQEQEKEGYIYDSGLFPEDGESTDIELFFEDGSTASFSYPNLDAYKDYFGNYPQTDTVYRIKTAIMGEVRRQSGTVT